LSNFQPVRNDHALLGVRQPWSTYALNAWDNALGTVVSCKFAGKKGRETTCAADLVRSMNLHNCIVTAGAPNVRPEFAAAVCEKMGDYCLPVKDNQPLLYREVRNRFAEAAARRDSAIKVFRANVEAGCDRLEHRTIRVLDGSRMRSDLKGEWPGLEYGCIVEAVTEFCDKKTGETAEPVCRFFFSSLLYAADDVAETIYNALRSLWSDDDTYSHFDVILCQERLHCTSSCRPAGAEAVNKLADYVLEREIVRQRELGVPEEELTRPVQRVRFKDPGEGMRALIRALYPQGESMPL